MKSVDEILVETHYNRDFNYADLRKAFGIYNREIKESLTPIIFSKQQLSIWNCLSYDVVIGTKEIVAITGLPSKNVSTVLNCMIKRTGLIDFNRLNKLKFYFKKHGKTTKFKRSHRFYEPNI